MPLLAASRAPTARPVAVAATPTPPFELTQLAGATARYHPAAVTARQPLPALSRALPSHAARSHDLRALAAYSAHDRTTTPLPSDLSHRGVSSFQHREQQRRPPIYGATWLPSTSMRTKVSMRITDADLRDLMLNLGGRLDGNEMWEDVIDKRGELVSYKAKFCRPKKNGPLKYFSVATFEKCSTDLLRDFHMDDQYNKVGQDFDPP